QRTKYPALSDRTDSSTSFLPATDISARLLRPRATPRFAPEEQGAHYDAIRLESPGGAH
ncbi:hypothetical protein BaRGS_00021120, partial [Batillaria attramentaria]